MKAGVSVSKYHAGMSDSDRNEQQELFLRDEVSVMVATSAFGMGIDKSNIRYVIHYQLPKIWKVTIKKQDVLVVTD